MRVINVHISDRARKTPQWAIELAQTVMSLKPGTAVELTVNDARDWGIIGNFGNGEKAKEYIACGELRRVLNAASKQLGIWNEKAPQGAAKSRIGIKRRGAGGDSIWLWRRG